MLRKSLTEMIIKAFENQKSIRVEIISNGSTIRISGTIDDIEFFDDNYIQIYLNNQTEIRLLFHHIRFDAAEECFEITNKSDSVFYLYFVG